MFDASPLRILRNSTSRHMDITIRRAEPRDADTLVRFNRAMADETEGKALDEDTVRRGVQAVLDEPAHGFYLVAERENRIEASLLITREWSDWRNGLFWWIQSVYVRPERRRQGLYRALHEHVRSKAQAHPEVCGLRLYVEHSNEDAQHAYERLGMTKTSYRMYEEML